MEQLPFSQACENNKRPILSVISDVFRKPGTILEIGCGTGQHAVFFATGLPHLNWLPTDRPDYHLLCRERLRQADLPNLLPPQPLDVMSDSWPEQGIQGVFSANTAHIMHWHTVEAMFRGTGRRLERGGFFCLYGPFKEDDRHTSESNARFDTQLQERDPGMGIRDLRDLKRLAEASGLQWVARHAMPANNQILVWRA